MNVWKDAQDTAGGGLLGFEVWGRTWAVSLYYKNFLLNGWNFIMGNSFWLVLCALIIFFLDFSRFLLHFVLF